MASASGVSRGQSPNDRALTVRDGYERLAVASGETGATTDDDHRLDPHRLKPREDAVEALLRQFRSAIVRYCRSRLARTRTRTGSLDEDDVAQEVCLALLSAEDTGYVLDMSPGAVRVAQHRALVRLRALAAELGALGPGHPRSQ